jgi:hypothetical protein
MTKTTTSPERLVWAISDMAQRLAAAEREHGFAYAKHLQTDGVDEREALRIEAVVWSRRADRRLKAVERLTDALYARVRG